jgi:RNA polymerase sigma factor (sigma-70 family)
MKLSNAQAARSTVTRELLRRARAGESQAMGRLFARYLPKLRRWAHRRVPQWARSAADTADYVQETVLHTMQNLDRFRPEGEGALLGYLRQALMNRVRDQFRRAARRPACSELSDRMADVGASPLELTIDRDDERRYRTALMQLKRLDRIAIVARIELGYNYEQLALVLKKPTSEAARLAVRRALVKLSAAMRHA